MFSLENVLFKVQNRPIIVDRSFVPKTGKVILCGNHLYINDSKLVKFASSRNVVWHGSYNDAECVKYLNEGGVVGIFPEGVMNNYRRIQMEILDLEKEIIELNKNKFLRSSDCMTEVYFLQEQITCKLENLIEAKETLESNGFNVVDRDVVLPFSDYAVNLASKTNTPIVPFAITGDFENKNDRIKIRFGEPMEITGNLDSANDSLRESVKQLIYKSY